MTSTLQAEVMSIGDEIITGHRLDTNTQWLAQSLGEMGIPVRFHTSVGDELSDHVLAIKTALSRVDILIMTGGLGPTADDLTRQAIAEAVNVPLEFNQSVLDRIQTIYAVRGREMPDSNRRQAFFPSGSMIVPNPEGTAPGIDLLVEVQPTTPCRIFALPGVPVEMKQMWDATVKPHLKEMIQQDLTLHHFTLHCFGLGESTVEQMLDGITDRDRDPKVGITASAATISLRVSTFATNKHLAQKKLEPALATIRKKLGNVIFGEQDQSLEEVVVDMLQENNLTLALVDGGLQGMVADRLLKHDPEAQWIRHHQVVDSIHTPDTAVEIRQQMKTDLGVVVGQLNHDEMQIMTGKSTFDVGLAGENDFLTNTLQFGGHSQWRVDRAVKQVLNEIRLWLLDS